MKRTALWIGLPYTAGLLTASVLSSVWFPSILGIVTLCAIGVCLYRRSVWKCILLTTLSFLTACCVYWQYDQQRIQPLQTYADGTSVAFVGEITGITEHDSGYVTYTLHGCLAETQAADILCTMEGGMGYRYGDHLALQGTLETVQSTAVFDAASYYRAKNIFLRMTMVDEVTCVPLETPSLRRILYEWRTEMTERIQSCTSAECGAVMTGMLFGDKSAMEAPTQTALYRVGIGHVLAVSGLHLDFLAICVMWLLQKCRADRRLSFAVMMTLAVLFVLCVGETVSVKRACIMILISQSAKLFFRKADMLNSISIAMFLLCLEQPMVIHSSGFWLSFSGTFGIGAFAPFMTKGMPQETALQRLGKQAADFFCVFLAVFPCSILYFREVSLISPLSNMLLVPLCMVVLGLAAVSLLFGASGVAAELLLLAAEGVTRLVLDASTALASLSWTHFGTDSMLLDALVPLAVVFLLLLYLLCRSPKYLTGAIVFSTCAVCIGLGTERGMQAEHLRVSVLGEERDCAILLSCGTDALLIDVTCDRTAPNYVQAMLEEMDLEHMDTLVLCESLVTQRLAYEEALHFYPPETWVIAPEEEAEADAFAWETNFHGANVTVEGRNVRISYADRVFLCCPEAAVPASGVDFLTVYGTSKDVLPPCGVLMVLDARSCHTADAETFVGEQNLELTITEDGLYKVRRLYGKR